MDVAVSPWEARSDLAFAHVLRIVAVGRLDVAKPDICLFLADRYWRLAEYESARGQGRAAQRLREKAERYFAEGGGRHPPPGAVAARMPAPPRPTLAWLVGRSRHGSGPPDAA